MRFLCFGKRRNGKDEREGFGKRKSSRKEDGTRKSSTQRGGKAGGAGCRKGSGPFFCLHENALFWVFLVLLSIGCVTRLYQKAALEPASSGQALFAVRKEEGDHAAGQEDTGQGKAEHYTAGQGRTGEAGEKQAAGGNRNYRAGGRNLPIYCVETEKPQVALSFDAAWGGGQVRRAACGRSRRGLCMSAGEAAKRKGFPAVFSGRIYKRKLLFPIIKNNE